MDQCPLRLLSKLAPDPPHGHVVGVGHEVQDAVSLVLAQRVAARLRLGPEPLEIARRNLEQWSARNAGSVALLRCYAEWQAILNRPIPDVCDILCADTDEGRRLRQNSPFAGVLAPAEVWAVKRDHRKRQDLLHAAPPA